jgi:predicted ester cyclase
MRHAALAFYRFWATDDEQLLPLAISPLFVDRALPKGRPQGPAGPAAAGKAFHAAIPDLQVVVTQQLLVADRIVSHLRFKGHFTGTFGNVRGSGQPIDFIATDIVRVQNGLITDNWHIEDNLTFLEQIGLVAP